MSNYKKREASKQSSLKKLKNFLRVRKSFQNKHYFWNPTFRQLTVPNFYEKYALQISIKITPNNVFCVLVNTNSKKTIYVTSSGKCGVQTSKKTLKFSSKNVLQSFFDNIKSYLKAESFLVKFVGPKRLKRPLLEQITSKLRGKNLIILVDGKKPFNGCRAPKKRRKKQKGLRIFK